MAALITALGAAGAVGIAGTGRRRERARRRRRVPRGEGRSLSEDAFRSLVQRARRGETEAFGQLFEALRPDVLRLCRRLLGPGPAAEDAASEVFLRVRAALDQYDAAQPFRRWVLGIGAHHCIDGLRRRSREARLFEPDAAEQAEAPGLSPLGRVLRDEERRTLVAAVDALPERYRAPLVLRYFADLDYEGIGAVLGVTKGQVATLLFRAKGRLRAALRDGGSGGERW
jgi:RNA polymerase sigma-70 factor (ECF subfamily)